MSFDSLSNEVICLIFDKLDTLNELLNCRLVSTRCNEAVESMRIESLAIEPKLYNRKSFANRRYWFTDQLVSSTSRLFAKKPTYLHNIDFMGSAIMSVMLSSIRQLSIKHLVIKTKAEKTRIQNVINQFGQLVHLQVNTLEIVQKKYLFLANIRILEIGERHSGSALNLDAPNLRRLRWPGQSENIHLEYPEKLTHLSMQFAKADDLLKYPNLECLEMNDIIGRREKLFCLQSFAKLRELYLEMPLKKSATELVKKKQLLQNLALYLFSVRIANQQDVERLYGDRSYIGAINSVVKLNFIPDNYAKIPKHRTVRLKTHIDYNEMIRHFGDPLPADLPSIFINIQLISVRGAVNQTNFVEFLRKCKALRSLFIYEGRFDQSFYANLLVHSPFLTELRVNHSVIDLESIEHFDPTDMPISDFDFDSIFL